MSVFPPFALCVVRAAAIAAGARDELVRALSQLEAAVVSNGALVRPVGRRELSGSAEMAWGLGDMRATQRDAGVPIVPPELLAGRSGLYVEAAGLRVEHYDDAHSPRLIEWFCTQSPPVLLKRLSCGSDLAGAHSAAVSDRGKLYSWGIGSALGTGMPTSQPLPQRVRAVRGQRGASARNFFRRPNDLG